MSNIKHVKGDLLDPSTFIESYNPQQHSVILCHQVNCQGVMLAGVALGLAQRYPEILPHYQEYANKPNHEIVGTVLFVKTNTFNIAVANLFGQVYAGGIRATNYEYIYQALEACLKEFILNPNFILAFPKNMSSALGGANWAIIYLMIQTLIEKLELTNTIYIVEYVNPNEV